MEGARKNRIPWFQDHLKPMFNWSQNKVDLSNTETEKLCLYSQWYFTWDLDQFKNEVYFWHLQFYPRLSTCAEGTVQVFKLEVPTKSIPQGTDTGERQAKCVFEWNVNNFWIVSERSLSWLLRLGRTIKRTSINFIFRWHKVRAGLTWIMTLTSAVRG